MSKNFELLQQTKSGERLFQAPNGPAAFASTSVYAPAPAQVEELPQSTPKASPPQIHLPNLAERNWRQPTPARNGHRRANLEAIAREEEIKLVQRVFFAAGDRSPRTVLFSSLENEAGCASICARTGETLADQMQGPVCVVDANLSSPSLHQYFGIDNHKGLAEAILESGPVQDFIQQLSQRNLSVMPSGCPATPLNFRMVPDRLQSRMTELRTLFKYVVIHSSPLDLDADSILLSRWTDGVVLVVEADSTRRETARRVKENLAVANVPLLGVVLNNRSFPIPESLYRRF